MINTENKPGCTRKKSTADEPKFTGCLILASFIVHCSYGADRLPDVNVLFAAGTGAELSHQTE